MREIWKQIVGADPHYQVSNKGRLRSLARTIQVNHPYFDKRYEKTAFLKSHSSSTGYICARYIDINGNDCKEPLHRIIAKAFIPNPNNYPYINHIDGNKHNNSIENLEWCTRSMNMLHAYRTGLNKVTEHRREAHRKRVEVALPDGSVIIANSVKEASKIMNYKTPQVLSIAIRKNKFKKGFCARILTPRMCHLNNIKQ